MLRPWRRRRRARNCSAGSAIPRSRSSTCWGSRPRRGPSRPSGAPGATPCSRRSSGARRASSSRSGSPWWSRAPSSTGSPGSRVADSLPPAPRSVPPRRASPPPSTSASSRPPRSATATCCRRAHCARSPSPRPSPGSWLSALSSRSSSRAGRTSWCARSTASPSRNASTACRRTCTSSSRSCRRSGPSAAARRCGPSGSPCASTVRRWSSPASCARRQMVALAGDICSHCVPREPGPMLTMWMDRVQEAARQLA